MHKRFTRLWPWLLLAVFLLSLVPVLWLGQYARAGADDYCYGIAVHRALQEGGSLLEAVWHTVSGYYQSWQGTFSALAFMSLTPCSWSEGAYWITPVVLLVSLAGGTFYLSGVLCRRLLGGSRRDGILVALALLFPSIQCLAQPLHSFYWWNGAVYYTFTYGLSLFYLAGLTGLFLPGRPRPRALAVGALLGILVGGSNYVSALLTALLDLTALAGVLWRRRERLFPALVLVLPLLCAFAVSVLAPGNQVRQSGETPMTVPEAIFAALEQGWSDLLEWPNWLTLISALALIPLLWRLAGRTGWRFPLPPLFTLVTFLFFSAQNAPHFYAASSAGPDRLRNIIYFSHFWVVLLNECYYLGWLRRVLGERRVLSALWLRRTAAAALAALLVGWLPHYWPTLTSVRCWETLSDGSAAAYARQRDERLPALLDPEVTDPRFSPITARPALLYLGDITTDPADWHNNTMAVFYGKHSVALLPPSVSLNEGHVVSLIPPDSQSRAGAPLLISSKILTFF